MVAPSRSKTLHVLLQRRAAGAVRRADDERRRALLRAVVRGLAARGPRAVGAAGRGLHDGDVPRAGALADAALDARCQRPAAVLLPGGC